MEETANGPPDEPNDVEKQLKNESAAQRFRQRQMRRRFGRLGQAWTEVKRTAGKDHNTLRLTCVIVVLLMSFFGSLILVIANPDAPFSREPLYGHSDMVNHMTQLREKALRETPPDHESRWNASTKLNWFAGVEREIRLLLDQWWPLAHAQFDSNDVLLNEQNFFAANYGLFKHAFATFNVVSNLLLFFTWFVFITAKEVHKIRLAGKTLNSPWRRAPSPLREFADENDSLTEKVGIWFRNSKLWLLVRLKRFFWWLPAVRQEWFDLRHPKGPIWNRQTFFTIFAICALHIIVEIFLIEKPSFFALIYHQSSFVVLSILCLASTYIELEPNEDEEDPGPLLLQREPQSLRGSFRANPEKENTKQSPVWSTSVPVKGSPKPILLSRNGKVNPMERIPESDSSEKSKSPQPLKVVQDVSERMVPSPTPIEESLATSSSGYKLSEKVPTGDDYPEEANPFSSVDEENGKV